MAYFRFLIIPFVLLTFLFLPVLPDAEAQNRGYELIPAPDLWYNDVDGIRVGVRLKGQVPGTFEDGPHRLDAGFWLSTWFPSLPVSYYLSYTEPIPAWSDFGSEASLQFISSIRTGYHRHGVGLNKRWQQGFDERRYREVSLFQMFEKRFDDEYVPFPQLWSDRSKVLFQTVFELQDENPLGWYNLEFSGSLQYFDDTYGVGSVRAIQRIPFSEDWGLRLRGFLGAASSQTDPEYLFSRSSRPAADWMGSGITRAKGTIPQPWMESGHFQIAGGANLRGYTDQDVLTFQGEPCVDCFEDGFVVGSPALFHSFASINAEFDYFNPVNLAFRELPYIAEFLRFRSYLFFDAGRSLGLQDYEPDTVFANAGAGFSLSLNIPDYLGKPRGFVLRYEMPFWLSEPGSEEAFTFRHLFGFGAVISF